MVLTVYLVQNIYPSFWCRHIVYIREEIFCFFKIMDLKTWLTEISSIIFVVHQLTYLHTLFPLTCLLQVVKKELEWLIFTVDPAGTMWSFITLCLSTPKFTVASSTLLNSSFVTLGWLSMRSASPSAFRPSLSCFISASLLCTTW